MKKMVGSFSTLIHISILICLSQCVTVEEDLTLTPVQKLRLDELKSRVWPYLTHDYMKEEIFLMRWLRSRNFNVEKAKTFLLKSLRWREESKIDEAHNEDWSDIERIMPYYLEGRDKVGKPILYVDIGNVDLRRLILQGKGERFQRYLDKGIDEACGLVRELGVKYGNITRGHLIVNIDGYNLVQQGCLNCIPLILNIVNSYQRNWPGCVDKLLLLNSPSVFEPLLNGLRGLMDQDTRRGLMVFGTNRKLYKEKLSSEFDFDQLPPGIGGTKLYQGMDDFYY